MFKMWRDEVRGRVDMNSIVQRMRIFGRNPLLSSDLVPFMNPSLQSQISRATVADEIRYILKINTKGQRNMSAFRVEESRIQ